MGFDQAIWVPAITPGGTGANNSTADSNAWDVPGSTKLNGSVDAGSPWRVGAGSSSFSPTPLISEINLSSDFNQVNGLINRRIKRYNTLFGTTVATVPYFSSSNRVKAADLISMQTAINNIRTAEGLPAFIFTIVPTAALKILGSHLAELRKALRISGVLSRTVAQQSVRSGRYEILDSPSYPAGPHFESLFPNAGNEAGKLWSGSAGPTYR